MHQDMHHRYAACAQMSRPANPKCPAPQPPSFGFKELRRSPVALSCRSAGSEKSDRRRCNDMSFDGSPLRILLQGSFCSREHTSEEEDDVGRCGRFCGCGMEFKVHTSSSSSVLFGVHYEPSLEFREVACSWGVGNCKKF